MLVPSSAYGHVAGAAWGHRQLRQQENQPPSAAAYTQRQQERMRGSSSQHRKQPAASSMYMQQQMGRPAGYEQHSVYSYAQQCDRSQQEDMARQMQPERMAAAGKQTGELQD